MNRVLINGVKANTGGGKAILNNYLELLCQKSDVSIKYYVLTPNAHEYSKYSAKHLEIVDVKSIYKRNIFFPLLYYIVLPNLLKKLKIDLIFNFGDVIIPTKIKQVYMFDWAYAVYPECPIWEKMCFKDKITRSLKVKLIRRYIGKTCCVTGQTNTICNRLKQQFGITQVKHVPNAVNLENFSGENTSEHNFKLDSNKFNLLYISTFSPHKNFDILLPLAKYIKNKELPFKIILTLDSNNNAQAANYMGKVNEEKLESIITNLGHVDSSMIAALYQQGDALLMPTLLESYGLPYVEAMFHGKTVLTSDLDFAHDVCGDAAFYFDPFSAESILENIKEAYNNIELRNHKIEIGKDKIANLLTWGQVFEQYQSIIESNLEQ